MRKNIVRTDRCHYTTIYMQILHFYNIIESLFEHKAVYFVNRRHCQIHMSAYYYSGLFFMFLVYTCISWQNTVTLQKGTFDHIWYPIINILHIHVYQYLLDICTIFLSYQQSLNSSLHSLRCHRSVFGSLIMSKQTLHIVWGVSRCVR